MTAVDLDSSAIVKLVIAEARSAVLRKFLRRRRPLVSRTAAQTGGLLVWPNLLR
jgi:hypothetical protein